MTTQKKNKTEKIISELIKNSPNPALLEEVFEFAKMAYREKSMPSGENYLSHASRVAEILYKMGLDPITISFGLLHDIMDDKIRTVRDIELKAIENKFGKEISGLLERISELRKIRYSLELGIKTKKNFTREKLENTRKMFLAIAGDLRVVLVELVSRLDSLRSLSFYPEDRQRLQALETLQIFVPIASRLGLSELRRELEDTAFYYLLPKKFNWLEKTLSESLKYREKDLKKLIDRLKKIFKKERIQIEDINFRTKSHWSTYKKLLFHGMDFEKIHDLMALRIIAKDVESCYRILGIIHKHFRPISEEINDYIAKPKLNGYRSLHTTVYSEKNKITEIQIRTGEMHKEAEYGICAHWSYKEKINLKTQIGFEWIKEIPGFWENFKIDFFPEKVFVFTPKGDIVVLPKDSTPIDFAYAVHSDIGNRCESAKINGKIAQLSQTLENGDVIEIGANKNKNPSKDWLRFVKTSLARSHIKKLTDQPLSSFKLPLPNFIRRKIIEISEAAKKKKEEKQALKKEGPRQIYLAGQKGMLIHVAKCCNPRPGDKVKAYITQRRAAVLHLKSCENLKKLAEKFPEKIIDASWE